MRVSSRPPRIPMPRPQPVATPRNADPRPATGKQSSNTSWEAAAAEAKRQPGIRAWSAADNASRRLRPEHDGAFLGALGQPIPRGIDLDSIAGVLPSDGQKPIDRVVFVNGVASTRGMVGTQMQQIADMTGGEVVGLYNATEGVLKDAVQTLGDRVDLGENAAVSSLARLIHSRVEQGVPLRLASYSQGALITSRAIEDVRQMLLGQGLSEAQVEAKLSWVTVETFGGAASHYPDGPRYVHHINRWDPVTLFSFFALGSKGNPLVEPGRNAVVYEFSDFSWRPSTHSMNTYLKNHRTLEELLGS